MRKFTVCACSFLAAFLFLFSCSSGLGESIDLEAPVLEITSPEHGVFVPKSFTLKGTAIDNKKVNSVEIEYKYKKDGETISGKEKAILAGEKWHCDFSFDGDYEVEFEAYAYDALKNGSDTSHQRIMLLIDSQDPETDKMSIIRGDYVARLHPLEEFTKSGGFTELKNEPKNKDNFQNEKIVLVTTLNDNYGIGNLSLDLYEVDPETKSETIVLEKIPMDSQENKYSPRFTISDSMLPQRILTGVHYLKPSLSATDEAGNKATKIESNVFAWESEYNRPHVSFNSTQSDGRIEIQKDSPIIVTVFDDDKIKSCRYSSLVKEGDFISKDSVPVSDHSFEKGSRDLSFEIDTKEFELGSYFIVIKIEDDTGRDDGKYYEAIPVSIRNASAPVIIVDTPEANSAPKLDANGNFEIKGRIIDDEENLNKIAIAWLPKGNSDISNAETLFKDYDFGANKDGEIKIYKLDAKAVEKVSGKPTYEFSKTFNFFNDFTVSGNVHNENKVFMIAAKDPNGNLTTNTFRLSKISSAPKFRIGYTNKENTVQPSENFMFTPLANRETTFTIEPYSESNLQITSFSVTGSDNGKIVNDSKNSAAAIEIKFNLNEASLGKVYKYTLSAQDKIGGTSKENLTIQFDQFGVLESITCEHDPSSAFTKGNTIRLQANFDFKVYVNGKPYIQLSGDDFKDKDGKEVPETSRRAVYASGNNSNTLYFEYVVPEGIECTNLTIGNIERNGAVFEGDISKTWTNNVDSKNYKIDSIEPYIESMFPSANGVVKKENDSVTITFQFNEPVTVESGTVIIQRTDGWYIPPVISEDVFLKIYNEKANNADKITLCGTDDLTSNEKYITDTRMPEGPYMQYTNGIIEKDSKMVPDLTTKYVLAYEHNIGDTSETVTKLRGVLERAGYHKAEIDSSRMHRDGDGDKPSKKWTLNIENGDFIGGLVNGVEYKIIFYDFKVYDEAFNYFTTGENTELKVKNSNYRFWVGPVATPVIRVNRTATNDTKMDGKTHNPFNENGEFYVAQTTFKIDCESPNATVKYGTKTLNTKNDSNTLNSEDEIKDKTSGGTGTTIKIDDLTNSQFNNNITCDNKPTMQNGTTSEELKIGESNPLISEKIYIKAVAQKDGMDSATGQEGAFKTVIHYFFKDGRRTDWSIKTKDKSTTKNKELIQQLGSSIKTPLRIHGAQLAEGSSYTAGWPLTQNGNYRRDYQIAYTNGDGHFYWVSWQVLSGFNLQTYSVDFQNPANPNATYGMYYYCNDPAYWGFDTGENN